MKSLRWDRAKHSNSLSHLRCKQPKAGFTVFVLRPLQGNPTEKFEGLEPESRRLVWGSFLWRDRLIPLWPKIVASASLQAAHMFTFPDLETKRGSEAADPDLKPQSRAVGSWENQSQYLCVARVRQVLNLSSSRMHFPSLSSPVLNLSGSRQQP